MNENLSIKSTKNINRLFVLDQESSFIVKEGISKKDKIICTAREFNEFIQSPFSIKNVIILAELDWDRPLSTFHGYEIAKELFHCSNREIPFNLLFVSTLSRNLLYDLIRDKNRIFVQKFHHRQINDDFDLNHIKIGNISRNKFNYLKNYCLLESGILDRLEHDVRRMLGNPDENELNKLIENVEANEDVLTPKVIELAEYK